MISTRGRYALRVMIDLAEHRRSGYITMKEIAERQELSIKYMERIMPSLTEGGLVEALTARAEVIGWSVNRTNTPLWKYFVLLRATLRLWLVLKRVLRLAKELPSAGHCPCGRGIIS